MALEVKAFTKRKNDFLILKDKMHESTNASKRFNLSTDSFNHEISKHKICIVTVANICHVLFLY